MGYINVKIGKARRAVANVGRVDKNLVVNIGIIHTPAAILLVEPTSLAIPLEGGVGYVAVTSNTNWVVL